jgi:hypothetical protein
MSYDTVFESGVTKYRTFKDTIFNYVPDYPASSTTTNWTWPTDSNTYQGITKTIIADASDVGQNRWILGIDVFPNDANKIMFTVGGYDTLPHVYFVHDTIIAAKQNNLQPSLPVYDVAIDHYNSNNIVLGTDIGIWSSDNGGNSWTWQKTSFTHVPVFRLRQAPLLSDSCMAMYAATFGRGIYRSTSLIPAGLGCNTAVSVKEQLKSTEVIKVDFYPNPTSGTGYTVIDLPKESIVTIKMFDLLGQQYDELSKQRKLSAGRHVIEMDLNLLPSGNYLLSLKTNDGSVTKRISVMK